MKCPDPDCGGTLIRERTPCGDTRHECAYCDYTARYNTDGAPVDAAAAPVKVKRKPGRPPREKKKCLVHECRRMDKRERLCAKHLARWITAGEPDISAWVADGGRIAADWKSKKQCEALPKPEV